MLSRPSIAVCSTVSGRFYSCTFVMGCVWCVCRLTDMAQTCIHWFRKGLRLHDNPALMAALRDCKELYPVFILDPYLHNNTRMGINCWRFLIGALKDLDCSLRKLNSRYKERENFPKHCVQRKLRAAHLFMLRCVQLFQAVCCERQTRGCLPQVV